MKDFLFFKIIVQIFEHDYGGHMEQVTMDKVVSLSKSRGFIFPGSDIYGGLANTWDYGPLGVELKNNEIGRAHV